MCGIGGIVRLGNRPIRPWQLKHMATELQHRGHDATGFAIMDVDGRIQVWKDASPAWKAVALQSFEKWLAMALTDRARIALVHTRQYTKGSPNNNENNHPLFADTKQGVVIHNGMVRNDDALFAANKEHPAFKRSCVTDSDIFRAVLDRRRTRHRDPGDPYPTERPPPVGMGKKPRRAENQPPAFPRHCL